MSNEFGKKWTNLDQPTPNRNPQNSGLQFTGKSTVTSAPGQENVKLGTGSTQVNNLSETVALTHT